MGNDAGCPTGAIEYVHWSITGPGEGAEVPTIEPNSYDDCDPPFGGCRHHASISTYLPGSYIVTAKFKDQSEHGTVDCRGNEGTVNGSVEDLPSEVTKTFWFTIKPDPVLSCTQPGADRRSPFDGGGGGGSCGGGCSGGDSVNVNERDGTAGIDDPFGDLPRDIFNNANNQYQLGGPLFEVATGCLGGVNNARFITACGDCVLFTYNGSSWTASPPGILGSGWSITSNNDVYTLTLDDGTTYTATGGRDYMDSSVNSDGTPGSSYTFIDGVMIGMSDGYNNWAVQSRMALGDPRPASTSLSGGSLSFSFEYGSTTASPLKKVSKIDGSTLLQSVRYGYDGTSGKVTWSATQTESGPVKKWTVNYDGAGKVSRVYETVGSAIEEDGDLIDPQDTGRDTSYVYGDEYITTPDNISHLFGKTIVTHEGGSDPDRVTTTYYYKDTNGNSYVYKVIDPEGNVTEYWRYGWLTYFNGTDVAELKGQVWEIKDALGRETIYEYYPYWHAAKFRLKKVTQPDGKYVEYTYNADNFLSSAKDTTRGTPTVYTFYDYYDQTYPKGMVRQIRVGVNPIFNDVVKRSVYQVQSGVQYGKLMEDWTIVDPTDPTNATKQRITKYDYEEFNESTGQGTGVFRPSPTRVHHQWWDASTSQYVDKYTWTHYEKLGEVLWTKDELGDKTSYDYDLQDRVTKITYPGPTGAEPFKEYHYTCCGLDWESDENGNKTYYDYDERNRVIKTRTDVQASTESLVEYTYDNFNAVKTVTTYTNASTARVTTYTRDILGRITEIDYPGTGLLGSEYYQYDTVGNLIGKKIGDKVTAYKYDDDLDRLLQVDYGYNNNTWPIPSNYADFDYDDDYTYEGGSGLVTQRINKLDPNNSLTSGFEYDTRGRLFRYTPPTPSGWTVEYGYNNANDKMSVTVKQGSNQWATAYGYYLDGSLKSVDGPAGAGVSVDYTYDAAGKPLKEINGNDTFAEYSYDNRLHLSSLKSYKVGTPNVLIAGMDYETDAASNPTEAKRDDDTNKITTYGYDDINRLDDVTYPGSVYEDFVYDWVGNRTGTGWGAVNDVDQLPSDPFGNSYAYDSIYGNLATRTKSQTNTTFEYDNYNLLKKINWPGSVNTQFVSDSAGNRVSMTTSDEDVYKFIYDITAGIPAVLMEQEGTETPKIYVRTPDGRLIARINATVTNPSLDFYYHFDQLGSTLALTNSSGTATDTFKYDAWGQVTRLTGTTKQPYLFVGQLGYYTHCQDPKLDPESADSNKYILQQLGVRYYSPEIGRFTQRDEDGAIDESAYTYAGDHATSAVDTDGRKWRWPWQKRKDDSKAGKWLRSTFRKATCKVLDASREANAGKYGDAPFPIGRLLGELNNLKKLSPSARQEIMEACQEFVNVIKNPSEGDTGPGGYAFVACVRCANALVDYLGHSLPGGYYSGLGLCKDLKCCK